jgi:hypothetical protein
MKYEIFEVTKEDLKFEIGLMHSEQLTHADVAETMQICLSTTYNTTFDGVKVVAAGFCSAGLPVKCWGHSESLNMSTRGDIDELVLMQTNLNFENVYDSDFDSIKNVLRNFSQTCGAAVGAQWNSQFVVGHEITAYNLMDGDFVEFEEGMLLRYKGPTINADGQPAHLFAVSSVSKYYADYDGIYSVDHRMLRGVFHDSPLIRKLAKMQSGVVLVDDVPQVVNITSISDPFPLTTDHDQVIASYIPLGGGSLEQRLFTGTLQQIAEHFHLETE